MLDAKLITALESKPIVGLKEFASRGDRTQNISLNIYPTYIFDWCTYNKIKIFCNKINQSNVSY